MKKLLFFFAALLQTALVMGQNPVKQQMPQQNLTSNSQESSLKKTTLSEQKANRPWIIVADPEETLRQDRVPSPPGPNSAVPIVFYQYK